MQAALTCWAARRSSTPRRRRAPCGARRAARARAGLRRFFVLQGDYVVLASEPVCIVGVDVAAPQQVRAARGAAGGARRGSAIEDLQQVFQQQFTAREVRPLWQHGCLDTC